MTRARIIGPALLATAAVIGLVASPSHGNQPSALRIGLVNSIFRDVPTAFIPILIQPFPNMLKAQAGIKGEVVLPGDAHDLGQQLSEDKVHFGVFHGIEFGWAQEKYPDLRPLLTIVNRHHNLRANLVVRDDSPVKSFADLKGKSVGVPKRTREHCHLFLEKFLREAGKDANAYFDKVIVHPSVEDALDDIVRGKVDAVVVDTISLELYEQIKSGCFERLKIVSQSSRFPEAVIAYRHGALEETVLKQFRKAVIDAKNTDQGRDLMALWKLTGFEPMPADFAVTVANIIREYPPAPSSPFRMVSKSKAKNP